MVNSNSLANNPLVHFLYSDEREEVWGPENTQRHLETRVSVLKQEKRVISKQKSQRDVCEQKKQKKDCEKTTNSKLHFYRGWPYLV